jgi:protease-4
MQFQPLRWLRRGASFTWRALDVSRRVVLNLIFVFILIALLVAIFSGAKPLLPKTVLVLDLKGTLVEEHTGSVRDALLDNASGRGRRSVQLRDVLAVLDAAGRDPNISSVLFLPEQLSGAGLAMQHEIGAALERVKKAGKPVIAWAGSYDQRQYLMSSHASEVYLHPMGVVAIQGFGQYRHYYRDALDKLGVKVNVVKVGTYKSFAEPFVNNGPSPEAAEADAYLYNGLWADYTAQVEKNRKLAAGAVSQGIEQLPRLMEEAKGNMAQLAVNSKLVDGLKTRDQIRTMMMERGAKNDEGKNFRQVSFDDYLGRHRPAPFGNAVGVIVASGEIRDGQAPQGTIGGLSTATLIRRAREDDQVKALVLRVDSPGGSAYGSELIRRELELTRAAGKPVVISMGNLAASGGYWISMAADEVMADRSTITGSIGVFALVPTAEKVGEKLGIHTGGSTTTWLADAYNPLRPLDPRFTQVLQSAVGHIYGEFTRKAAQARKTTPDQIDQVGQGRVWTGAQAKERGLVDSLGTFKDALASAAKRAGLPADARIAYIQQEGPALDKLLSMLSGDQARMLKLDLLLPLLAPGVPPSALQEVGRDLSWLNEAAERRSPFSAVVHCLCTAP